MTERNDVHGNYCYGANEAVTVITYPMAGGSSKWGSCEVHYDPKTGDQTGVYILDREGRTYQPKMTLFVRGDYLRMAHEGFVHDGWVPMRAS